VLCGVHRALAQHLALKLAAFSDGWKLLRFDRVSAVPFVRVHIHNTGLTGLEAFLTMDM